MSPRDDQPNIELAALLLDIQGDVRVIKSQTQRLDEDRKDHETRIRRLERFRYAWPSTAVVGLIFAGVMAAKAAGAL